MARSRSSMWAKKWIVDHFEDYRADIKIPIHVNPDTGRFGAKYKDENHYGDDPGEVKEKLKKLTRRDKDLVWTKHIQVVPHSNSNHYSRGRRHYTPTPIAGITRLIRFQKAKIGEDKQGNNHYRYARFDDVENTLHIHRNGVIFDYDEELWQKLCMIEEQCKALHMMLYNLLTVNVDIGETEAAVEHRIRSMHTPTLMLEGAEATPQGEAPDRPDMKPDVIEAEDAKPKRRVLPTRKKS